MKDKQSPGEPHLVAGPNMEKHSSGQTVREILSEITSSLVDENIVPHDQYEDAVTDEDIVLIGEQLIDDAEAAINAYIVTLLEDLKNKFNDGKNSHSVAVINSELDKAIAHHQKPNTLGEEKQQ